jgi:hypothetical protein
MRLVDRDKIGALQYVKQRMPPRSGLSVFVHRQLCGVAALFPGIGTGQEISKLGESTSI